MNIAYSEIPFEITVKTCACQESNNKKKITYLLLDDYHSLCLDKKEILLGEIQACERLLKYAEVETEKNY